MACDRHCAIHARCKQLLDAHNKRGERVAQWPSLPLTPARWSRNIAKGSRVAVVG